MRIDRNTIKKNNDLIEQYLAIDEHNADSQKKRDQILINAFIKNKPVIERCIASYVDRNPVNYDIRDLYQISFEVFMLAVMDYKIQRQNQTDTHFPKLLSLKLRGHLMKEIIPASQKYIQITNKDGQIIAEIGYEAYKRRRKKYAAQGYNAINKENTSYIRDEKPEPIYTISDDIANDNDNNIANDNDKDIASIIESRRQQYQRKINLLVEQQERFWKKYAEDIDRRQNGCIYST